MKTKIMIFSMLVLFMTSSQIYAQDKIDPRADQILKEMSEYLKGADQFALKSDIFFDQVLESGQKIRYTADVDASVKRPNKFQSIYNGDLTKRRVWYDGKSLTVFQPDLNFYATADTKPTIDQTVEYIDKELGLTPPLCDFILSNPYKALIKNVKAGYYLGQNQLHGYTVHHLAFTQEDIDWEIWIEAGKKLVPRMLVITYKKAKSSPQYTALMYEWDFSVRLPDSLFTATIPQDTQKIEFLSASKK